MTTPTDPVTPDAPQEYPEQAHQAVNTSYPMNPMPGVWTLTLNKYQRDNLLWLLNKCGAPDSSHALDELRLHANGDWAWEIADMLGKIDRANRGPHGIGYPRPVYVIDANDHPNQPPTFTEPTGA